MKMMEKNTEIRMSVENPGGFSIERSETAEIFLHV